MDIKEDIFTYLTHLKRFKWIILSLYVLIETYIIVSIGTKYVFMTISSVFVTLFILCTVVLLFMDFSAALLIYVFAMPILPMVLYLLYRLNITWLGNIIMLGYFFVFIYNVYITWQKKEINFKNISFKGKYKNVSMVYAVLFLLGFISVINSRYKFEAAGFYIIGFVIMIVYSVVLLCYKGMDVQFSKKIIMYLTTGVVISGMPDALISIYYMISKNSNQHLYGALGSNFMLGYTIILLPILVYNALSSSNTEYKIIYRLLLIAEIFVLSTQISRGILITLFICFLSLIAIDRKSWFKYLIVGILVISCVRYNVLNRWEFSEIKSNSSGKPIEYQLSDKNALVKFILKQSGSRRDIWAIAFEMINDHPSFGVGPGHFKYYYIPYGGEIERSYADSHNIVLNITTELGVPFSLIFFSSIFVILIKAFVNSIKSKNSLINRYLLLLMLGIVNLLIYGNITGQAFMTFVYPISTVPAFIFIIAITIMIILYKYEYR
jgi:O-antigen ligase